MPKIDPNKCLKCGFCAADCPVGAIQQGKYSYEIVQSVCVNCGQCIFNCVNEAVEE